MALNKSIMLESILSMAKSSIPLVGDFYIHKGLKKLRKKSKENIRLYNKKKKSYEGRTINFEKDLNKLKEKYGMSFGGIYEGYSTFEESNLSNELIMGSIFPEIMAYTVKYTAYYSLANTFFLP